MRKALPIFLGVALALPALAADAPGTVAVGDNLVAEHVPPIPQSLADSVGRYSEFRSASFGGWHPTRRELLVATRFADSNQVHVVKSPGGDRRQLTFYPDNALPAGFQPSGTESLVFRKDQGGDEFFQFYRLDLGTGAITLLTDGKSRNTTFTWSNRGTRAAYVSSRRNGRDTDLWMLDSADPKADHLVAELAGGGWGPLDWSPDDATLLVQNYISANQSELYLFDAKSGAKTLLTPAQEGTTVAYPEARFSRDGKGVYAITDRDDEFRRIAYIDLATKRTTYLTTGLGHDVSEFELSWDGKTVAYVVNEDGLGVLHLMDLASRKELKVPKLPNGIVSNLAWRRNAREFAFDLDSDLAPDDVYSYDLASAKLERWTHSETGGLDTGNFARSQLVHWKSWDDRSISGFLYRPPPAKFPGRRPVVINIHGGPESQFRPGYLGRNHYLVNELGVALIYPNVRGSSGFGKTFLALDNGRLREGSYRDIEALLDWIKAQPDLDSERVLVTGGSYGGFMTLAVATNYNDRIRCSIDIVGPSNFVTFLENTSGYRQDLRRVEYGDERDPDMRAYLEKIAPMAKAQNITKPMFVIQGYNDPRVPHTESEQMVAIARRNQTPVWYLMAKDEGHGFAKKRNADFQFYATIAFVRSFLLP
jgi:dipeptidyl aminopeptidase/acylaminoacyl peptidase